MSQVLDGHDGGVYVAGSYPNVVSALDARDGRLRWQRTFPVYAGALSDCPLASDQRALYGMYVEQVPPVRMPFVPSGRLAVQHVYALDKGSGTVRWDRTLPHILGNIPGYNESAIPLLYGGTLYDGSGLAPVITALDPRSGAVKWQLHVNAPVKGAIVARDGVLYFGDLRGTLWAVDAHTGLALGSVATDTHFGVGSPIVLNDSLVVGSSDGAILAVPLEAIAHSQPVTGITSAPSQRTRNTVVAIVALLVLLVAVLGFRTVRAVRR